MGLAGGTQNFQQGKLCMKVQKKEEPSVLQSWSGKEGPRRKDHGPITVTQTCVWCQEQKLPKPPALPFCLRQQLQVISSMTPTRTGGRRFGLIIRRYVQRQPKQTRKNLGGKMWRSLNNFEKTMLMGTRSYRLPLFRLQGTWSKVLENQKLPQLDENNKTQEIQH